MQYYYYLLKAYYETRALKIFPITDECKQEQVTDVEMRIY